MVYDEGDVKCTSLKDLDATFRNVVPNFDDFVVASRKVVEDMCAVLIECLGRIGMDDRLRGTSEGISQTDPGRSHPRAFQLHYLIVETSAAAPHSLDRLNICRRL